MTKILIIEDEEIIRNELMDWLRFDGYDVHGAEDGVEGLRTAQEEHPDLIICDIRMPNMDGYSVLFEIRSDARLTHTPFIFLTANDSREAFRRGMDLGADDYLTKPFTHAEVMSAVESRLAMHEKKTARVATQYHKLQQALEEEKEKQVFKSRLVAMFSHDFRNPLAVISSAATLMRDFDDRIDQPMRMKKLNRIINSSKLLTQMLEEMLLVAEMESGQFEVEHIEMDISAFFRGIVDEFQDIHAETHRLIFQTNTDRYIPADPTLLRQIAANLISNAAKYSPDGSEILVELCLTADAMEFVVEDAGIGIPDEDIPHLFTPFYRAKNAKEHKGTGLGLAITKQAVDLCEGEISVESIIGEGSRFVVRIPYTLS